ncbi:MAG: cellulase family glycosylhydrolase, partial [Bacteroidia bacterium]|nr:cellulase family glycosylhydrolase [Bacteroidia bacterium]
MDQISNDAVLDIEAYNEIVLLPPTDLISYTNNGSFHARIQAGSLDPVSYHTNGWNNIGKWEKFEIGISLPVSVDQDIEAFLNGANSGNLINPYDYDKIKLRGIYTNGSSSYERFGFYYRDIVPTNNGADYAQFKSTKPFRIRFAPNDVGYWSVHLELSVNGVVIGTYTGRFNCIDTGKPGPISIGPHNRFQKADGGVFFPIGQDFGPLIHNNGPNQCGTTMHPNDVTSYIGHISNLADQGGNFIRIPMDIHNFSLEWEEARVYGSNRKPNENFKRQYCANSLDKVFDKIESRNLYSILLSETDNVFQVDAAYKCGTVSETAWPAHPYAALSDYGVNDPLDVFGIPSVFNDIYKKRLFYMNARYGYSPNLAVYEVCNEIDGIERGSAKHYEVNGSTRSVVYNWAVNTADYLKSFYPSHMTTISFRDLSLQDPWQPLNPTSSPSFDIRTPHHYGWDKYVPVTRVDKVNVHLYGLGGSEIMPRTTKKPVLFGEMGMSDEMGRADTCSDAEFHKGMWASGCSGAAGAGLYRYDYESDSKRNAHFPALHAFFDNMPFATDEFYGNDAWAPQGDPTTGVIYNYTGSKHKAYGWLYNFHYYWATDPALLSNCVQDDHGVQYGSSGAYFQEVELKNFQNSHMYNVELWRAYDGGGVQFFFHEQATLLAGKIKIKRNVGSCTSCEYAPDYGLKIYKEEGSFIMATTDEYSNNNE